jgi:GNAT superfamily N-acetyltransferase
MSLQLGSSARAAGPASVGSLPVRIRDRPTSDWLDVWQRVLGEAVDVTAELEMLSRVRGPSAYACARIGDDAVAVARAVAGDGWAGVFGMATMPAARGRGAAREVLASLARWARRHGAARMYLQVERDNSPALRLYERAGFREVCAYSYRSRRSG